MSSTDFFSRFSNYTGSWDDYLMLVVMVLLAALGTLFFVERGKHDPGVHSPRLAWLRAWIYYGFVLLFSSLTGVFKTVVHSPLFTSANLQSTAWILSTLGCIAVVIWGYVFWWPRGTLTHGRKLYLVPTMIHGFFWGVAAGLLYLGFYALVEPFGFPAFVNGLLVIGFAAVYSLNYQLGWWDIHVSPPHNIREWNNRKVALAHNPFLFASLTYFIVFGNAGIYVLLNAFAMMFSAIAMRFPPFWEADGPPVSRETAIGV